jgi:tagatose 1,6-diphosphate aldolase
MLTIKGGILVEFLDTNDLRDNEIYLHLLKIAEDDPPKGYVPAYYFSIIRSSDDIEVGRCDLRVGHNENTKYGGNIGYEVNEKYRGNGYASKACKFLFKLARKHNMSEIIITCSPDNISSIRTCEKVGAEYMGLIEIPQWHEMYATGRRMSCKYLIRL